MASHHSVLDPKTGNFNENWEETYLVTDPTLPKPWKKATGKQGLE